MQLSCQVCGTIVDPSGKGVRICPTCKGSAHEECWSHLGGCLTPACRTSAKEGRDRQPTPHEAVASRRKEALVRRRLGWIAAQRLGVSPDFHPDELRLLLAALVCILATGAAAGYRHLAAVQAFAMSALVVMVLFTFHRRERRLGRIHRWIPAENAPEDGILAADMLLELDEAGTGGAPEPAFRRAHEDVPASLACLDRCLATGLVARIRAQERLSLSPEGQKLVDEARSRAAPRTLEG